MPRDPRTRPKLPAGLVAGLVFLTGLLVLLLLLRLDWREPLLERVPPRTVLDFEADVMEDLGAVTLTPTHRLRVSASRVVWRDGTGASWLESPRITFSVQVGPAARGPVLIHDGVIEEPRLRLLELAPDRWNFEQPLAPLLDPGRPAGPDPAREVRLRNIRVRNGMATITRADATFGATDVDMMLASGVILGPGVPEPALHLSEGTGTLVLPDTADQQVLRSVAFEDARLRLPEGVLAFDVARFRFGASVAANLIGTWDRRVEGPGIGLTAELERVELVDVPWLRVPSPEPAVASGQVRVESRPGGRSALSLTGLIIQSATSTATGSLRIGFGPTPPVVLESVDLRFDPLALSLVEAIAGPLPYVGELRGTMRGTAEDIRIALQADLAVSPAAERFRVDVGGAIAFPESGLELRHVLVELHAVPLSAVAVLAPGLPLRGPVSGTVSLEGLPDDVPLRLDVRLETAGGVVTVAGQVDLRGEVPAYDLTGRVVAIELRRLLEPMAPPAQLHATFDLAGRGVALEDATARLRLNGHFTGWQTTAADTIAIRLATDRGLLQADEARLVLGPIDLTAAGEWRFARGEGGAIEYALAVASLEPLAPYLPRGPAGTPRFTRGALSAQGTLAGTLDVPLLAGSVQGTDFWFGEWAASRFEGRYDARLEPELPQVTVEASARDLRTPGGDFDEAVVALELVRPVFELRFSGDRAGGLGLVAVEADGRIEDTGQHVVVVRSVELDLQRRRWRLPSPARIEWTEGETVHVAGLRLEPVDGDGVVVLDGVVWPFEQTAATVEVAALPVGDLLGLIRADLALAGDLWLRGTVQGPADDPSVLLDMDLRDGTIRDVAVQQLQTRLEYGARALSVDGHALVEDAARIEMDAVLPVDLVLGLPPSVTLVEDAPVRGRLWTEQFWLGALDPAIPWVDELQGWLSANLIIAGSSSDPVLSGRAELRDGAVRVALLNQRYDGIEGEATLDGPLLIVDRLIARSDGVAALTGTVRFEDLANPVLDLVAELDRFRAQGVSGRRSAALSGRLGIGGTPGSPLLSGSLRAEDGTLDLARLQPPGTLSEDLIGIAERFDPLGPMDFDPLEPAETGLRIADLQLTAGNDLWFQSHELRAQLTGSLTVSKPADEVMITGTLTGQGGTFNLRIGPATRRFEIVEATVQFFGTPDPDPALDITAARIIPGPNRTDFELRVRVTGMLSSPAIAFSTADGTSIPEAEALNFLIFGRATATLADFPGAGLGTTQGVYDALAFYGMFDWLSAAIAEQFGAGIDYFQLQVRAGAGELGTEVAVLLGHEVVNDVFVLVTLPTTDFEARWALAAEWRIDRQWTLEAGYEPPDLVLGVPGRRLPFALEREQQLFMSLRRRWTY
jgi:hypothetical protein